MASFNGLNMHLGNLMNVSAAKTISISPENFTGAKGPGGMATEGTDSKAARDLGRGWRGSPFVRVPAGETFTLANIASTVFGYQTEPHAPFPALPDRDFLEVT